ncbi:hypothetical protein L596_018160 [Steinernema carpocapsae]|uniref:Uncharacterized protein n=1 Tax=Steinernema carpocapsae TaxID=34508 RepID=A0A4U5N3U3_STECR|nr:hypothetical protein L596_018160 [Steinernema carpocapsae]
MKLLFGLICALSICLINAQSFVESGFEESDVLCISNSSTTVRIDLFKKEFEVDGSKRAFEGRLRKFCWKFDQKTAKRRVKRALEEAEALPEAVESGIQEIFKTNVSVGNWMAKLGLSKEKMLEKIPGAAKNKILKDLFKELATSAFLGCRGTSHYPVIALDVSFPDFSGNKCGTLFSKSAENETLFERTNPANLKRDAVEIGESCQFKKGIVVCSEENTKKAALEEETDGILYKINEILEQAGEFVGRGVKAVQELTQHRELVVLAIFGATFLLLCVSFAALVCRARRKRNAQKEFVDEASKEIVVEV